MLALSAPKLGEQSNGLILRLKLVMLKKGEYREELKLKGGQIKVPCLKVEYAGEVNWLYNSNDIIDYLCERFS